MLKVKPGKGRFTVKHGMIPTELTEEERKSIVEWVKKTIEKEKSDGKRKAL